MAKPTPSTSDKAKPPKASMNVMTEWLPRMGIFFMKASHRSPGGGKIKVGTLTISTRISQSTSSATKNTMGSATSFQENFTALLGADVNGKLRLCQENH